MTVFTMKQKRRQVMQIKIVLNSKEKEIVRTFFHKLTSLRDCPSVTRVFSLFKQGFTSKVWEQLKIVLMPFKHSSLVESTASEYQATIPDPLREYYDNLWAWKLHQKERRINYTKVLYSKEDIEYYKWDKHFVNKAGLSKKFKLYMFNRMVLGVYRYFLNSFGKFDFIDNLKRKISTYEETGNTEFLIDVANIAMLEFKHSIHPKKHFHAGDSDIKLHDK
jgi:hypothetical protein